MLDHILEKLSIRSAMFFLWLVLIGVVFWLGTRELDRQNKVMGFVETKVIELKPMMTAKVEKVLVIVGDSVKEGQPIAMVRKSTILNPMANSPRFLGDPETETVSNESSSPSEGNRGPNESATISLSAKPTPRPSSIVVPLLSPVEGIVSQVLLQKGELTDSNHPVAEITVLQDNHLVICLPDTQAHNLHWGSFVEGVSMDSSETLITARVTAVSPRIEVLPDRCQMYASADAWGRVAMAEFNEKPASLIPGQRFNLMTSTSHEWIQEVQHPLVETTITIPHKIKVPPQISSQSSFEPSGVIWSDEIQRFIVVSDDTGKKKETDDAAWLFTMNQEGVVDPKIYPIFGSKKIDDMESITQLGKHYFVLASLSESEHGNRDKPRSRFVKLEMENGTFQVVDQINFIKLLKKIPKNERKKRLGVHDFSSLDIEGMTASEGKLYFGLKSPLDDHGRSIVWVAENPDKLFSAKSPLEGNLHFWRSFDLNRDPSSEIKYGISEILGLPNGEFLLAANVVIGDPEDPWGLIWKVDPKKGAAEKELLFEYHKFKPEGLSLTPNEGRFLVTFDRGGNKKPRFIELPWIDS